MSNSIDRKVVEARFDNKGFQKGVGETLSSVGQLQKGLKLDGATKGLSQVEAAARSLGNKGLTNSLGSGIATVATKFGALQVAGVAAIATIANKVTNLALTMAKKLTFQLPQEGFAEYELKLGSIQTIMAGSGADLATVNAKLDELNTYADKTIYSFADMTQNIGKFTNAGVSLDQSVAAIQGVANVAAVSGANSNEASRAMYNFAQALSKGYVQLIDWKSIELANMGTVEFKTQLLEAAEAAGSLTKEGKNWVTTEGNMVTPTKNFNESLTDQWLTTEVLTNTLEDYADETTEIGKKAYAAAQDVKTFTQLIDTVKEAIGSGWAQTFEILIGNFDEAKELFTDINDVISKWVGNSADARNRVLSDWKKLGGRTILIDAIGDAFGKISKVLNVVKKAFRDIFPATTGRQLYLLTTQFYNFIQGIKIGGESLNRFGRTIRGVFAIFGIGWEVIKATASFLGELFGQLTKGSGGLLKFTARIGDFFTAMYEAVKNGEGLTDFFDALLDKTGPAIDKIKEFVKSFKNFFNFEIPPFPDILEKLQPLLDFSIDFSAAWQKVKDVFVSVWEAIRPIAAKIGDVFSTIKDKIVEVFTNIDIDYSDVLATLNTGLFAVLVTSFKGFLDSFRKGSDDAGKKGGLFDGIKDAFGELTNTLSTMQNTLRATTLLQIAAAIGIMAVSLVAISKIDADDLKKALLAMSAMFLQLFASLAGFQAIGGARGLASSATGLILLATALLVLTKSVEKIGQMDWEDLKQGLWGVGAMLGALVVVVRLMSSNTAGMFTAGAGLLVLAFGIKILASAVTDLAGLSWEEMKQGLIGVGALLLGLALFTRLSETNKGGISSGAGLILMAAGIKILASATADFAQFTVDELKQGLAAIGGVLLAFAVFSRIADPKGIAKTGISLLIVSAAMLVMADALGEFAKMSWEEIQRGLASMGGALLGVVIALNLMPPNTLASAVALVAVAGALVIIGDVVTALGQLSWEEIAHGLVALGGALAIIALGVNLMSGAIAGALALIVVAGALQLITPILVTLGNLSWQEIALGLGALAGVFLVLGVAGLVLTPLVPTILALGVAIALIGVGVGIAGAGLLAMSVGLTAIAVTGAAAGVVIIGFFRGLIGLIPQLLKAVGEGLVLFAQVISKAGPPIMEAMSTIMMSIIGAIEENIPGILKLITTMAQGMLKLLRTLIPDMAQTALEIILGILKALRRNVPKIVSEIATLAINMLRALTKKVPAFVDAGVDFIVALIRGVERNVKKVITAGTDVIIAFIEGIGKNALRLASAAAQTMLDFINGLSDAIDRYAWQFREAGRRLALSIIDGITGGLGSKVGEVVSKAREVASNALDAAKRFLGINSPSREFMKVGAGIGEGMILGMDNSRRMVEKSAANTGKAAMDGMKAALSNMDKLINADFDLTPKITPVIDMTEVQKGASQIDTVLGQSGFVGSSYLSASQVASNYATDSDIQNESSGAAGSGQVINYVQKNYSPKALSPAEIYRQTRNQLATTKGALSLNAT